MTPKSRNRNLRSQTKLLILNTPCNPTGSMIEEQELVKIAALAVKDHFYILAEEIYLNVAKKT